jgi:murein DD-endopeptidase MepM/ murein hydrolase activator NlpD
MKWSRQKFTFMVIPDANSQVVRFQLSAIILLSALVLFIVLAGAAATAVILYGDRAGEVGRLKGELTASAGQFEKIISEKERHIGDLETEVAGLSDQAKSIQDKMTDIHKLESQLKEITGIESSESTASSATGGEELPVTDEAVDSLLSETHQQFSVISGLIDEMKPRLEQTKDTVIKKQKLLRVTPTIWPTDSHKITSGFGIRRDPFTRRATFHSGLDFGGDTGDPIYAAAYGTVTEAGHDGALGISITVSHGNGIQTRYSHLSKVRTAVGTKVSKGERIADLGNTGRSTGPHLHYEVFVNGIQVNPKPYLQGTRKEP